MSNEQPTRVQLFWAAVNRLSGVIAIILGLAVIALIISPLEVTTTESVPSVETYFQGVHYGCWRALTAVGFPQENASDACNALIESVYVERGDELMRSIDESETWDLFWGELVSKYGEGGTN